MKDKIILIKKQPDTGLIHILEELLRDAQAGDITSMIYCVRTADQKYKTNTRGRVSIAEDIGILEIMKFDLLHQSS